MELPTEEAVIVVVPAPAIVRRLFETEATASLPLAKTILVNFAEEVAFRVIVWTFVERVTGLKIAKLSVCVNLGIRLARAGFEETWEARAETNAGLVRIVED